MITELSSDYRTMSILRKIILSFSFLLSTVELLSQTSPPPIESVFKQQVVVTPDMAMLARNVQYPINYSTGTPQISIPLYTIQCGSLTLPLSLTYNASGIRVDDIPGVVGQGWSLVGIPSVSRKANGHIDKQFVCQFDEHSTLDYDAVLRLIDSGNPFSSNDEQPDEYYYQLAGKSGMFMYLLRPNDTKFTYASLPYNDVKIELTNAATKYFTITDDDGTIYHFNGATDYADFPNASRIDSGWKASSMTSANGVDNISFTYEGISAYTMYQNNDSYAVVDYFQSDDGISRWPRDALYTNYYAINNLYIPGCEIEEVMKAPVVYHTVGDSRNSYQVDDNGNLYSDNQPPYGPLGFHGSLNTYSSLLKTISYRENRASFSYTSYNGTLRLKSIEIRNLLDEVIRTILLDYDFYPSNRCFLKSVSFIGTSDNEIESYRFEYESPYSLPPTGDKRIDFWGYYNGNRQGGSLVPRMTLQTLVDYPNWHNPLYYSNTTVTIGATNWDNRASDETYMKYGTLKSITYPTGAKDEFLFEANQIKFTGQREESEFYISDHLIPVPNKNRAYYVGGLRIKQIKTTTNDSTVNYRTFAYNSDGTGTSPIKESVNYFMSEKTKYYYNTFVYQGQGIEVNSRYRTISSTPLLPLAFCNGAIVMYNTVTEYNGHSETDNEGKTVYHYNIPTYKWNVTDIVERLNHKYADWEYGHLTRKEVYKRNGSSYTPVVKEDYSYTSNFYVGKIWYGEFDTENIFHLPGNGENQDFPSYWKETVGCRQCYSVYSHILREKSQTVYDNAGNTQITTENFDYSIPYCTLLTRKRTSRNNIVYTEDYEYPYHYSTSIPYNSMMAKNMLTPIVKTTQTKNAKTFEMMMPYANYHYKPSAIQTSYNNNALEERINFEYDSVGNKVQASKDGRENVVYLYGYQYQYPIAVIENATYNAVNSVLGEGFLLNLRMKFQPSDADWNRLNQLRCDPNHKDWHVTVYKYKPLVGIISLTEPSGKETRFYYDGLGRLVSKRVLREGTEEHIEEYDYHYNTEQYD